MEKHKKSASCTEPVKSKELIVGTAAWLFQDYPEAGTPATKDILSHDEEKQNIALQKKSK